jgi:hypothetical protein
MPEQDLRNWRWMLAETAVVVAGILIAFTLNSWWQGRSAAVREQAHLHALRSDFEENVTRLEGLTDFQERVSGASGELLLVARGHRSAAPDSVDRLLGQVFSSNRFDAVMGAYEDLVNSGGLAQIRDDTLRSALAGFASMLDSRYAEQFSTALYLDFTRAFVGELGWADAVLRFELAVDSPDIEDGARNWNQELLQDSVFQEHLALRFLSERDLAWAYRSLETQARQVLDRIEHLLQ